LVFPKLFISHGLKLLGKLPLLLLLLLPPPPLLVTL
jgi:hypothetical protein